MNTQKTTNSVPLRTRSPAEHNTLLFPEETGQVWAEAGFLPPAGYRQAVALLHRLAMAEEPMISLFVCAALRSRELSRDQVQTRGYQVLNSRRLRRIAEDYGINPGGRGDEEVAHAVTLAIIGEYWNETHLHLPADMEGRA